MSKEDREVYSSKKTYIEDIITSITDGTKVEIIIIEK